MPIAQITERYLRDLRSRCAPLLGLSPGRATLGETLLQDARHANRLVLWLLSSQWLLAMVWFVVQHVRSQGLRGASLGVWTLDLSAAAAAALPIAAWVWLVSGRHDREQSDQVSVEDAIAAGAEMSGNDETVANIKAMERQRMLSRKLNRAITEGRLQVVYQPLFSADGRVTATEALARWHDDVEGNVSPAEFIPIAEATGLITTLSTFVMRQACEQMRRWIAAGHPMQRIAVNVSVSQVCRKDFVATVVRVLQETQLQPCCLELEVTEGALARDFELVKQHLQTLRGLGVRISIDDFGTGYSSLGRLRELQADVLKIDKIFVQSAAETPDGRALVQAIIEMAHALKLSVIAEGVETPRQMDVLRTLRCDEMQGFLLSRPQSPEVLAPLLHSLREKQNVEPRLNVSNDRHRLQLLARSA